MYIHRVYDTGFLGLIDDKNGYKSLREPEYDVHDEITSRARARVCECVNVCVSRRKK